MSVLKIFVLNRAGYSAAEHLLSHIDHHLLLSVRSSSAKEGDLNFTLSDTHNSLTKSADDLLQKGVTLYCGGTERENYSAAFQPKSYSFPCSLSLMSSMQETLHVLWQKDTALLFFTATGIVVRHIAPLLIHKTEDPAVLVLSFDLKEILPILSGHIGGAHRWAGFLQSVLANSKVFLSTASDQLNIFSIDMFAKNNNLPFYGTSMLALLQNRLVEQQKSISICAPSFIVKTLRDDPSFQKVFADFTSSPDVSDWLITHAPLKYKDRFKDKFICGAGGVAIGIGTNRGVGTSEIDSAVSLFLNEEGIDKNSIVGFASATVKESETGLLDFIRVHRYSIRFFSPDEIRGVTEELSSSRALDFFDIPGVAEPSAILLSEHRELVVKKRAIGRVTLAAAL